MSGPTPARPARGRRALVLGAALAAFLAALALAPVRHDGHVAVSGQAVAGLAPVVHAATLDLRVAADQAAPADAAKPSETPPADANAAPAPHRKHKRGVGVTIDSDSDRVVVQGFGRDQEYDSFEAFVERAPWIAALVFGVVFLTFMVPLVVIALLVWYKVRKTRMQNETMLKLAEKGVVPPSEAMTALAAGTAGATLASAPATAPLYEQARQLRKQAAGSDLRKGVILLAIGLSLCAYSLLDDRSPNWPGLLLTFLGTGYLGLWFFEDRQALPARNQAPPPAGGA